MKRLIFNILLFLFIITCPWWLSVLFAIFILYYLKSFQEIVLYGLAMDILYGVIPATAGIHLLSYHYTLLFLILLLSSFFIKKRLKFYSK